MKSCDAIDKYCPHVSVCFLSFVSLWLSFDVACQSVLFCSEFVCGKYIYWLGPWRKWKFHYDWFWMINAFLLFSCSEHTSNTGCYILFKSKYLGNQIDFKIWLMSDSSSKWLTWILFPSTRSIGSNKSKSIIVCMSCSIVSVMGL